MFGNVYWILAVLLATNCLGIKVGESDFDEFVEYINDYIDFTTNYTLNTNNEDMLKTNDSTIYDYGTFDFIIVGGGPAGTLLARRLSEISDWKILLIEAGNITDAFTDIPFMNLYTRNSPYNWGYKTVPQNNSCLGMEDQRCIYPIGKGLGGSAILGDSGYTRGNRADYDGFAALGLDGWSYDDLLPYFKKVETVHFEGYDPGYHGHDGPLPIDYTYPNPITYDYYLEAAKLAGLKSVDYNGENQIGISKIQQTVDFNIKVTGGNTFILPILNTTTNLNLTTGAFVTKIHFDNTTATGIQFIKNGRIYNATASKEVLLSAGAINSPQLLLLSGVGPKEDLEDLNITVVKDLPVGKYLMDSPVFVGLYIRTNLTADAGNVSYWLERWTEGLGYYTTIFSADNMQFINTKSPGVEPPNMELVTLNHPTSVPPNGAFYNLNDNYTEVFESFNTLTDFLVYVINIHPQSRGWVKLNTSNPADFPLINPAFYTDTNDEDIVSMYEAIQFVIKLLDSAPLQRINATLIVQAPGCEDLKSESEEAYWYCTIKHLSSTKYQPGCTTRMGVSPINSVLDKNLKVHGMSKLRVVDYGSYPSIIRGHPLASIGALSEKAADLIKQEYGVL